MWEEGRMIAVLLKSGYHAADNSESVTQCGKHYTSDDLSCFDWDWLLKGRHVTCKQCRAIALEVAA
jgi:hypothetical protein